MTALEVMPLAIRHQHHVGTFEPKHGIVDALLSLLHPAPQSEIEFSPVIYDFIKLPFQPEQRLTHNHEQRGEDYGRGQTANSSVNSFEDGEMKSSVFAVRTRKLNAREMVKHSRRDSICSTSGSPSLHHLNILNELDFVVKDLEISVSLSLSGIHLGTVILRAKKLGSEEADCYFKQLVRGTAYLHSHGIAHRDLKPTHLQLTTNGILKIANFSVSESFGKQTSGTVKRSKKRCGSIQYIAPEVLIEPFFDPMAVDMWAVGLIYMEMRMGNLMWDFAAEGADEGYDRYLMERTVLWGYRPIENLKNKSCRRIVHSLLDPCPEKRSTAVQVLKSSWCYAIELCDAVMLHKSSCK